MFSSRGLSERIVGMTTETDWRLQKNIRKISGGNGERFVLLVVARFSHERS